MKNYRETFLRNIIGHSELSPSFNRFQSAYRRGYSTETALLRLLLKMTLLLYCAADKGSRSLLVLLDLSAAFDCIDNETAGWHALLVSQLQRLIGCGHI